MFKISLEDTDAQTVQEILNKLAKQGRLKPDTPILYFYLEIITTEDLADQHRLLQPLQLSRPQLIKLREDTLEALSRLEQADCEA